MKRSFEVSGNSDVRVKIRVQIKSSRYSLTRYEVANKKAQLQNDIHRVLRNFGYDVKEIQFKK